MKREAGSEEGKREKGDRLVVVFCSGDEGRKTRKEGRKTRKEGTDRMRQEKIEGGEDKGDGGKGKTGKRVRKY